MSNQLQVVEKTPETPINALDLVKSYGENAYLIAPATDRFSVSTDLMVPYPTQVIINPNPQAGDVHVIDGRLALSASALGRLSTAAGIVWSERQTRPLTVTKDYICYRAVGYLRLPDGSTIPLIGTKEIDLDAIEAESRVNKCKKMYNGRAYDSLTEAERVQVDHAVNIEMVVFRKHRMGRAETGAKTRAIKSLGIRSSYTAAELSKPFMVVRWGINPNHEYAQAERQALWGELRGQMPANPLPPHEDLEEELVEVGEVDEVDEVGFEVDESPAKALQAPQTVRTPAGESVNTRTGEISQPEPPQEAERDTTNPPTDSENAEQEERAALIQSIEHLENEVFHFTQGQRTIRRQKALGCQDTDAASFDALIKYECTLSSAAGTGAQQGQQK